MSQWMINCKDFAALVSERLDRPLSFWDKFCIKIHLMVCPPCHHIQDQLDAIRRACSWLPVDKTEAGQQTCCLPEQARVRIKEALKKNCV